MDLNSKTYWDQRFDTNWVTNLGRQQSAFFSKIALSAFPEWLVKEIVEKKLSILDWGCALGDGTNEMAQRFPENKIYGIDFSDIAVKDAGQTYPTIHFEAIDLLAADQHNSYDVVFSSNTLEHFAQPWQTAKTISKFARQHMIILVPYKEKARYAEHLYTFNEANIPATLSPSFSLTHLQVVDGSSFTPNYWGELQVLMVYTNNVVAEKIELKKISDTDIRLVEMYREQACIQKDVKDLIELVQSGAKKLEEKDSIMQQLQTELSAANLLAQEKENANKLLAEKEIIIHSLEKAISDLIVKVEGKELVELELKENRKLAENNQRELEEKKQELLERKISLAEKEQLVAKRESDIQQLQGTVKELENMVVKMQQDINWYRTTFEQRSIWGLLKDKTFKPSDKKQ